MDPTPHEVMPKSQRVWLEASSTCRLKNLKCVLQINLEPITLQVCVPFGPKNCLLFITMELDQRVAQNLRIHGHMILMPQALPLSRWASGLAWLHGHIVVCPQMPYQVVFGRIRCIAPINLASKFGPILCPMDTFYGN
jgi:hypothetical protein